ncbi:MAG: hypothetical protein ABIE42_09100 [Candidatus Eisenbacteria bacterium]
MAAKAKKTTAKASISTVVTTEPVVATPTSITIPAGGSRVLRFERADGNGGAAALTATVTDEGIVVENATDDEVVVEAKVYRK